MTTSVAPDGGMGARYRRNPGLPRRVSSRARVKVLPREALPGAPGRGEENDGPSNGTDHEHQYSLGDVAPAHKEQQPECGQPNCTEPGSTTPPRNGTYPSKPLPPMWTSPGPQQLPVRRHEPSLSRGVKDCSGEVAANKVRSLGCRRNGCSRALRTSDIFSVILCTRFVKRSGECPLRRADGTTAKQQL